jgi:small-conductance mechanosensitive channel
MTRTNSGGDLQSVGNGVTEIAEDAAVDVAVDYTIDRAEDLAARHTGFGIVWNLLKLPFILSILSICLIATVHLFLSDNLVGGVVTGFLALCFGFVAKRSILALWSKLKRLLGASEVGE